ncbi:hypothetical protein E8E13_008253 [Curvularia kusanoi]|uniref:Uncharacterized protein n=1 Tax=Curvularia kusanoi TaxID=90978 RepID=A0A9P4TCW8_CURKU|nr:hypothetical protein E8E13_008253 [Curvularia kusanoi]
MLVDANSVPASSILALVATLGCVALLSFLARVCALGRGRRCGAPEQWILACAAICVIGDLVITVAVQSQRQGTITILTVFWFGSALLLAGPITVSWNPSSSPSATARLLVSINSTLDVVFSAIAALLPLPLLWTERPSTAVKFVLLPAYILAIAAIASASLRTYLAHSPQSTNNPSNNYLTALTSSIELSTSLLAIILPGLPTLLSSVHISQTWKEHIPHYNNKPTTLSTDCSPPRYLSRSFMSQNHSHHNSFLSHTSRHTYASTSTVLRHSVPARTSIQRFHDNESNVTFDIATPARSRAATLRSYPVSRRASVWTEEESARPPTSTEGLDGSGLKRKSAAVSVGEIEVRTRVIQGNKERARDAEGGGIGVAVTTLCYHDDSEKGRDEGGEEMAVLRRLFADRYLEWGALEEGGGRK